MMRRQLIAAEGLHPRSASMRLTCDRSAAANLPKVIHPLESTMCDSTVQPIAPSYTSPNAGGGGGLSQEYGTAVQIM